MNNKIREIVHFTEEDSEKLICGESCEYKSVRDEFIGNRHGENSFCLIINRIKDNKFFKGEYAVQADGGCEIIQAPIDFEEVFPKEKTITIYE